MNALLIYLKLGLRNILKNKRRSFITLFSLAAGFSAIALFTGYTSYVYRGLAINAISGEMLGHLTITKKGYALGAQTDPERYSLSGDELKLVTKTLQADPAVDFVSPRITVQGLLSNGSASVIFIGEGVVGEHVNRVRNELAESAGQKVKGLRMVQANDAILGTDLARMMGLSTGDNAVLFSSTLSGMANAVDITVADTMNTGAQATNDKYVLIPFKHAQSMMDTQGASRLLVMLKDASDIEKSRHDIEMRLSKIPLNLEVKTWVELSNSYQSIKNLFNMIFLFVFSIVLTISITSVINTMGMVVMERTREIGTMRAMGMHRGQVVSLFAIEGMLLALLGGLIGIVMSVVLAGVVNALDVTYVPPNFSEKVSLQVELQFAQLLLLFAFFIPLGAISALVPAWNAAKRSVVDALGHV